MRLLFVMILVLSYTKLSLAEVNMKDASFFKSWIDIKSVNSKYNIQIKRTYNSRSLNSKILGFGWDLQIEYSEQNLFQVSYNKYGLIHYIKAPDGFYLKFSYNIDDRLIQITSSEGVTSFYDYKDSNLVRVKNYRNEVFLHQYDEVQNLTQIQKSEKQIESISYDQDRDRVLSYSDGQGCIENYSYISLAPEFQQTSIVEKKCNQKVVSQATYEFWYKTKSDGTQFLDKYKVSFEDQILEITYSPSDGEPVRILKNGKLTKGESTFVGS